MMMTMEQRAAGSYELMYGTGGHGGPYFGLDNAIESAAGLLRGSRTERTIYIVPRDERILESRNAVRVISKTTDDAGDIIIRVDPDRLRDELPMERIKAGDQFMHDGLMYVGIPTTQTVQPARMTINCVRLMDGQPTWIEPDTAVVRLQLANS